LALPAAPDIEERATEVPSRTQVAKQFVAAQPQPARQPQGSSIVMEYQGQ